MKNTEAGRSGDERPQWGDNVASTTSVAAVGTPLVAQSPTRSSKRIDSEKGGDVGGRKKRGHHRRKHNELQPAVSPSGVSSVSSCNEELASASNVATHQGTSSPAIEAEEEKTARHRDAQDGAAESKAAAGSVLPGRPAEPGPAASTISKTAAGAASKTTAGRPHTSKQEHASRVADIYEALATLAPSPEKQPSKPEVVNPFTTLTTFLDVRHERSSTDYEVARSAAVRRSRRFFVTVLAITVFVVIVMTSAYVVYAKTKSQHQGICLTNDCDQYRRLIEDQLDNDVDPCDDFGAYVCGRWNPREEYRLSRSQLSDMFLSWLYKLPETLKKGAGRIPAGRKVLAMFRSCMSQTESKIRVLKKFMRDRGIFWPDNPDNRVPPLQVLFDLSFNWNVHLWFTLKMLPAVPNVMPRRIFLRLNDLMVFWKLVIDQIPEESFHRVYEELYDVYADDPSKAVDGYKMSETYNMLTQVFKTIVPSRPRRARTPGLFRLRDVGNQTPFSMGYDMINMFNAVMRIDPPVTMDDLVLVSGMSQLAAIWEIIKKAGDNALWLFVLSCASVANPAAFLLVFHGSEHRAMEELPRFCAGQIEPSYKLLIAAIASVVYFSRDERRHINERLDGIVKVAIEKTEASSWLDNATKRVAVEKLKSVRTVLWPTEKFLTAKVLDDIYRDFPRWAPSFTDFWIETRRNQRLLFGSEVAEEELRLGDNTHLPYVEYVQALNRLSLSLGALAPPLYYREGTKAMLYGGILYRYARALIGAIDNEGVKVNAQGEIVPAWLSGEVRGTFEERTLGCLSGNDTIFPEIPAMEVAYAAFKRQLGETYTQLSKNLTEEKVFFITSCLATCAVTPADNVFGGSCNKAVMNFAPFSKAFGCTVGSPMNPVKKCSFYD